MSDADDATRDCPPSDPNATIDGPAAPAEPTALPTVPGYDVTGVLGRGAMGVVYAARHLALNRPVALKMVLAGAHADAEELVRFRHEAELLARVTHPNVVGIYEVGAHAGLPYFALEFCPGGTLHAKLAGTPQPPRAAATLAATLARAVQAAHAAGVIHRDLKPGNVLLAADGTPKLADFGLGRLAEFTRHLTQTGAGAMGTPAYMPPEQAAGDAVGPLADVYALGALLYCFLTGRPPHQGATQHETLALVKSADPAAPRSLVPGLPRDVETIALKALHKEPGRRYATAAEFAADLERWLAGEPIHARPAGRVERAVKWARRRPVMATLAASGSVGLVAFVAFLLVFNTRLAMRDEQLAKRNDELAARQKELDGKNAALRVKDVDLDRGQRLARQAESQFNLLTGKAHWDRGSFGSARASHEAVAPADRHWEWHALRRVYHGDWSAELRPVESDTKLSPNGRLSAVHGGRNIIVRNVATGAIVITVEGVGDYFRIEAWSANSERFVVCNSVSGGTVCRVWDVVAGRQLCAIPQSSIMSKCALSRDGLRLAITGDRGVVVHDATTGVELYHCAEREFTLSIEHCVFAPDGRRLATVDRRQSVRVYSIGGDEPVKCWPGAAHDKIERLEWSQDGRQLKIGIPGRSRILDLASASKWSLSYARMSRLSFTEQCHSPDGRLEAIIANDRLSNLFVVIVCDALSRQQLAVLRGHTDNIESVAWSSDGRRLATAGDYIVRIWEAVSGREIVKIEGHSSSVRSVAWSPDNRQIITGSFDDTARIWDATDGRLLGVLDGHAGTITAVAWSPDCRLVATASHDGTARVWDVVTRRELATLRRLEWRDDLVAWSPDGRWLAIGGSDGVTLWDGSPDDGDTWLRQFERRLAALPLPEWHQQEAQAALAAGFPQAAKFHLGYGYPRGAALWLYRGEYIHAAAYALAYINPATVVTLLFALRRPGDDVAYHVASAITYDRVNDPAARKHWLLALRQQARRVRRPSATESDWLALADLRRMTGDDVAANATLTTAANRFVRPILVRDIASFIAANVGPSDVHLPTALSLAASFKSATSNLDGYLAHDVWPLPQPQCELVTSSPLLNLRAGRTDAVLAEAGLRPAGIARLCAAIVHARAGRRVDARRELAAADAELNGFDTSIELLRREALAAISKLESTPK